MSFSDLRVWHVRQEVSDRQDVGGALQGGPLEQQALRVHTLWLQGRAEGFIGNLSIWHLKTYGAFHICTTYTICPRIETIYTLRPTITKQKVSQKYGVEPKMLPAQLLAFMKLTPR